MNLINRILGIFTEPTEVFEDINKKPNLIKPGLVLIGLFSIMVFLQIDFLREGIVSQLKMSQEINPAVKITDELVEGMVKFGIFAGVLSAIITPLVKGIIVYGISILQNGKGKIKETLSVILYSYFVVAAGQIILTGLKMATGNANLTLSPAMLLSTFDPTNILYMFLSFFDIFVIAYLVVSIIGIKIIHKFSYVKASIAVLAPTVLLMLITLIPMLMN